MVGNLISLPSLIALCVRTLALVFCSCVKQLGKGKLRTVVGDAASNLCFNSVDKLSLH